MPPLVENREPRTLAEVARFYDFGNYTLMGSAAEPLNSKKPGKLHGLDEPTTTVCRGGKPYL